jgi:hypothetical protein
MCCVLVFYFKKKRLCLCAGRFSALYNTKKSLKAFVANNISIHLA